MINFWEFLNEISSNIRKLGYDEPQLTIHDFEDKRRIKKMEPRKTPGTDLSPKEKIEKAEREQLSKKINYLKRGKITMHSEIKVEDIIKEFIKFIPDSIKLDKFGNVGEILIVAMQHTIEAFFVNKKEFVFTLTNGKIITVFDKGWLKTIPERIAHDFSNTVINISRELESPGASMGQPIYQQEVEKIKKNSPYAAQLGAYESGWASDKPGETGHWVNTYLFKVALDKTLQKIGTTMQESTSFYNI